jgi:hypothetical protein
MIQDDVGSVTKNKLLWQQQGIAVLVFHHPRIMTSKHCVVSGTRGIGVNKS